MERYFVLNRFAISLGNYVFDGPEPLMGDPLFTEHNASMHALVPFTFSCTDTFFDPILVFFAYFLGWLEFIR